MATTAHQRIRCHTCRHPHLEQIDEELSLGRSAVQVAKKWGLKERSVREHRAKHIDMAQAARRRHLIPSEVEVDIDELARQGGKTAALGFRRILGDLIEATARYDAIGDASNANKARQLTIKVYGELADIGMLYPGKQKVTNNNLVLTDGAKMFELMGQILGKAQSIEEARRLYAAELRRGADPLVIETKAA